MIEVKAKYTDGGVNITTEINGKGGEIVLEVVSLFMSLPEVLAKDYPELFAEIADLFGKVSHERIKSMIVPDMTDGRAN